MSGNRGVVYGNRSVSQRSGDGVVSAGGEDRLPCD